MNELARVENAQFGFQFIRVLALLIFLSLAGYYLINIGNRYVERKKRLIIDIELIKKILIIGVSIIIVYSIIRKFPIIGRVIYCSVISLILAYIINPLVNKLEKKGIGRAWGVGIVYLSIFIIFLIIVLTVFPRTVSEVKNLILRLPEYLDSIADMFGTAFDPLTENENYPVFGQIEQSVSSAYENFMEDFPDKVSVLFSNITTSFSNVVQNTIDILFNLSLVLILTLYFQVDKDKYFNKIKSMIPDRMNGDMSYLYYRIDNVLNKFISGRILMAVFVGVATAIMLLILRIDFAIVIGLITCVADIVPYIGPLLGFVPAFLLALIQSPIKAIIVAIFYVAIQWVENNVVGPKILGNSMGMNPMFVFLCIVVGGGMFGVWGMIISVPLAAVGVILIEFGIDKYRKRKKRLMEEQGK